MLSVRNFSYTYQDGTEALKNISFDVSPGEFVLMTGPNGGGKSTLLKSILGIIPAYSGGKLEGSIIFEGKSVREYGITQLAGNIGIVLQDPESQITNVNVWEEVTFALGNLLFPKDEIWLRANGALKSIGLAELKECSVHALSGGQMQRLSIAALTALRPKVLIFDEPMASLDPIGVKSVVEALKTIKELVEIVIVASHWLDPFLEMATRLMIVDNGMLSMDISPASIGAHASELESHNVEVPQIIRIEKVLQLQGVKLERTNGSIRLPQSYSLRPSQVVDLPSGESVISLENVAYAYADGTISLKNITACFNMGARVALVGHNGAGKTTLVRLLAGLRKPTAGFVANLATTKTMMLQKPSLGFITSTVQNEISYGSRLRDTEVLSILSKFELIQYRDKSPFELSGGEQRRLSLALTTVKKYDLVILDEPTSGLDAQQVRFFQSILSDYEGTVICITHDQRLIGNHINEMVILDDGIVQFHGSTSQLSRNFLDNLGYPAINPTVALALRYLDERVPMYPEQLEVYNADSI